MHDTETKEKALALIAEGKSSADVARGLDISQSTVAAWKAKAGKAPKRGTRGNAEKFARLRERAAELRGRGFTQIRIAEKLGVSKSAVARWCAEAEIEAAAATKAKTKAKPKPVARAAPNGAPSPAAVTGADRFAERLLASAGRSTPNQDHVRLVEDLQSRFAAVVIERDALRQALDRITAGPRGRLT